MPKDISRPVTNSTAAYWFVGASYGGSEDQTPRFLSEGIWENGYDDKHLDEVRSMHPGDHIAIKATYTRKHNLPFDNRGHTMSVMGIKAIGTITENPNNGKRVKVNWKKIDPAREWYFYTHRGTVWRVQPGDWKTDNLISFTFNNKPQDIDRFCNAPYWQERLGKTGTTGHRFLWTKFYEAIADKIANYRNNRAALIKGLREISERVDSLGYLADDKYEDGTTGFVKDICPFTTMGIFNRGIKDSNRRIIATELAKFLGVEEEVPETFEGIPVLNNFKSWYFPYEINRPSGHIDALWDAFVSSLALSYSDTDETRQAFSKAYDKANTLSQVAWNLTLGLYWVRPWVFPSLDENSRVYIRKKLGISIGKNGQKARCSAADYLAVKDDLEANFQEPSYPVHSFPELSLEAWSYRPAENVPTVLSIESDDDVLDDSPRGNAASVILDTPYTVEDILKDGCFLEREQLGQFLDRLKMKKNIILQGPPGTGKTWLAKRLAFALVGHRDERKVRAVQFHPNLSYEDFVRGWRPTGDGKLSLADGVFMEAIDAALADEKSNFVVVIEEINRGNPAQIFGEMLTLLEAGKRKKTDALELSYPDADGKRRRVHIPDNLYVIGTMNIADRSLALVDLALRRRFAFVNLEPKLGHAWRNWVVSEGNVDQESVADIERRLVELNAQISADPRLGKQFCIGHSYVTPERRLEAGGTKKWFRDVVDTEIGPLLDEYWFDAAEEAKKAIEKLVQGW